MVASPDFQDFTQSSSRLQQQLVGSPAVSSVAGVQSATLPVPDFARSLNLLVTNPANVITLTVVGATTGFTYLNAVPAYDGGIYYLPAMPVVDSQITVTWYQVAASAVSIYAIASDEPISVSVFNPISTNQAISEHLTYTSPLIVAANTQAFINIAPDITTKALRCTVDNPANVSWGKVVGNTSGKVYFDGTASNTPFPTTPIPIDAIADATVRVTIQTGLAGGASLYVAAINAPDFSGSTPIANSMSANELFPDPKQSEIPNQLPVIYDGTIAASGFVTLTGAVAGLQYRVHALAIMQYGAVATSFYLEDSGGNKFFQYRYPAASNSMYVPLFGQLAAKGAGLRLLNTTGAVSGAVAATLWYSVL